MSALTVQQAFDLALQHHQAGRLAEAEAIYRQILAVQPQHADALHYLGVIAHQVGRHDLAIEWINRALMLNPNYAQAYSNLGEALLRAGRRAEAIAAYRRSLSIDPDDALVYYNLGNALRDSGQLGEATAAFRRALEIQPAYLLARINLGGVLKMRGQLDEAIATYEEATKLQPDYAEAWNNLGTVLRDRGRFGEAIAACQRALAIRPEYPDAYNNLGVALAGQERFAEALAAYGKAIQLKPGLAEAHYNLGGLLNYIGRLDEAVAANRRALELKADDAEAQDQLGQVFKNRGALAEAIDAFRTAARLAPENPAPQSNLIYTLHFQIDGEKTLGQEQVRWNRRISDPVRELTLPYRNERKAGRSLRIGYVSPHFRDHVVGRNLIPLFRRHDAANFEILCYSDVLRTDRLTELLRQRANRWRVTNGITDEALAAMIREDEVDILVDLTQHMGGNRLPMFARRPAPVQVSFAGYPESTGVEAIPYRISDKWLEGDRAKGGEFMIPDREGVLVKTVACEQVYLIDSFWCYDPCGMELQVNGLPAQNAKAITFGSLNNFCKVNEPLLKLWARVVKSVKDSHLVIMSYEGSHRQRTLQFLEVEGVESNRVEFVKPRPRKDYLDLYHRLDMVLDTFPYGGHTTSLDALWMGVPVVSLAGGQAVSRAGLSQLINLGLPELVAFNEDDYVRIAVQLAGDVARLVELRGTLRQRMEASVLMDARHFARQIEEAYRTMWRQWCTQEAGK